MNKLYLDEKEHLTYVKEIIVEEIEKLNIILNTKEKELEKAYLTQSMTSGNFIDLDEGNIADNAMDISNMSLNHKIKKEINKKIEMYEKLQINPYFAKIVINNSKSIYIGKTTLRDANNEIIVYDWRAPIASIFYEGDIGQFEYTLPNGEKESVFISQKLQIVISNGQIVKIYNHDDYMSDDILVDLKKAQSQKSMIDIIDTIQKEQNEIIRQPISQSILVDGPPGSGKTTIALHRIAYILYNQRKTIDNNNILLMLPNDVFNDYISDLLPELGEEVVKTETLNNLINKIPFLSNLNKEDYIDAVERFNKGESFEIFKKKSSALFYKDLLDKINNFKQSSVYFKTIFIDDDVLINSKEMEKIFYKNKSYSILKRINLIKKEINERYKYHFKKIANKQFNKLYNKNNYIGEKKELILLAKKYTRNQLKHIRKIYNQNEFIDYKKIYNEFLMEFDFPPLKNKKINFEDLMPITLIYISLSNLKNKNIKHIIIDEYQDLSNIQFEIIKYIYPSSTFTLVGDRNQILIPDHIDSLNDNFEMKNLKKSYRSTSQIIDYLNKILNVQIESIGINGPPVIKIKYLNLQQDDLLRLTQEYSDKLAIITPDLKTANKIFEYVDHNFKIINKHSTLMIDKNIIIPYYLSKGFEYNTVIILGNDLLSNKYLKYITASRTIRQLIIVEQFDIN